MFLWEGFWRQQVLTGRWTTVTFWSAFPYLNSKPHSSNILPLWLTQLHMHVVNHSYRWFPFSCLSYALLNTKCSSTALRCLLLLRFTLHNVLSVAAGSGQRSARCIADTLEISSCKFGFCPWQIVFSIIYVIRRMYGDFFVPLFACFLQWVLQHDGTIPPECRRWQAYRRAQEIQYIQVRVCSKTGACGFLAGVNGATKLPVQSRAIYSSG